ncbi:hypothetical protein ANN_15665 [Periplaneta americana]|uniref:Endonuclease-reverse transcriptase n=1 Tax=Periplaneta americana TaxID=6978 RepID=A0ABQ8SGZ2_PERAM|nr:hypothetical protein ANN_15665 [Periplaneta americana]
MAALCEGGNEPPGSLKAKVDKFKYFGATVTNTYDTQEEIKRRKNLGNACYYSVEKLLSSSLLSKNLKVRIYKTVILPIVLYGCETWTLTLREERRFRVFENKVLRNIFGAKRDEVTGEWRKLHNTELHTLHSSPDIIRNIKSRRLRWAGHVVSMGESRNAYRVLVGRPEGKRPLGRPKRRWENNIKMDLREVGYDNRDWINLAQDRDRWRAYGGFLKSHLREKLLPGLVLETVSLKLSVYSVDVFPGRRIGRTGPIRWPPRSPDLTPLDFFFWGFIKDRVYATKPHTIPELVITGFSKKTRSKIEYPNVESAIRPVPHGPKHPIPNPPSQLEELVLPIEQTNDLAQPSTSSDQSCSPEHRKEPHLIQQCELNDLIRDLNLTKQQAEILGSRLQ